MSRRPKKKARPEKASAVPAGAAVSPAGDMPGMADSRSLESESRPASLDDRWTVPGVCIFLAAVIWVVFGQTLRHEFVNFDDDDYITNNSHVQAGLTWAGVAWAFQTGAPPTGIR